MPSIEKFKESLEKFNIDRDIISRINEGYEDVVSSSPKKMKAEYFKRAVDIMDREVSPELFRELFEWNACCKSGAREKASKLFAKENAGASLEEKLEKISSVPYMGRPVKNEDGTITVYAVDYRMDDGKYMCACSNFNKLKRDYSVSKNYCFCCAGHFKYHYEIMLGAELEAVEIVSSPLDSNGEKPCVIRFKFVGQAD